MTAIHQCEQCDALPHACKAALLDRALRAEERYRDDFSEPGSYWKAAWQKREVYLLRAQETASRQQLRADRAESALRKAEKALRHYEWLPTPIFDDSDPEGRAERPLDQQDHDSHEAPDE